MSDGGAPTPRAALDATWRRESRRVLATLVRLLGSFDAAEEALHEAFLAAAEQWPEAGVPANPYAWLVSTGRFRIIDRWRRHARFERVQPALREWALMAQDLADAAAMEVMDDALQDDELRLLFVCCHPDLPVDARAALALREVAGLTTEEIARAYLVPTPTIAQRIVRAKARIRDERIPYEVPTSAQLPARLEGVLQVIYLVFNEGYAATSGTSATRVDLCETAIRLGRRLVELLDAPEACGLLALMLLHHARAATRVDAAGDVVLLEDQDRSRWDARLIAEATTLLPRTVGARQAEAHDADAGRPAGMREIGAYGLQAAIAAAHATAPGFEATDWPHIVGLYDALLRAAPSPIVALNRAAAIAMRDGPAHGLAAVDEAMRNGVLDGYALAHSARAELLRRMGQVDASRDAYARALTLSRQPAEQRFLGRRIEALATQAGAPTAHAQATDENGAGAG